jgi:hypothetical protein
MHGLHCVPALVACLVLAGCTDSPSAPAAPDRSTEPTADGTAVQFDEVLHDELVAMARRDQTGGGRETADDRIERLKAIIDEHGWPTIDLVGKDGEDAVWLIAQHADLDPQFQQQALELLRDAVEAGEASPGNLAYLEDRVAAANGLPQVYGTQIQCGRNGPVPSTPIEDAAEVEERRSGAGLEPLSDYLDEMTQICSEGHH